MKLENSIWYLPKSRYVMEQRASKRPYWWSTVNASKQQKTEKGHEMKINFRFAEIELNLLHDAESRRETTKVLRYGDSDLLDWKKDTFHITLKSFIGVINIQLSFLFLWSCSGLPPLFLPFLSPVARVCTLSKATGIKRDPGECDGIKRLKSFESHLIA